MTAQLHSPQTVFGVDFTSAPSRSKSITCAHGSFANNGLAITHVERLDSFLAFENFLQTPGPWIGAFDFPFGLPRELVGALGWPETWLALTSHIREIGKEAFKDSLNRVRESRPVGAKYIERRGDRAAGSSSPMKLVNPPVGLMYFEGAPRLAYAGVSVMPCAPNTDSRIAVEAYPGYLARQITRESYKKDGKEGHKVPRVRAREDIVAWLLTVAPDWFAFDLELDRDCAARCIDDGSGDTLDAVLCCVQAAASLVALQNGDSRYGIPFHADDFEGWIATVSNDV